MKKMLVAVTALAVIAVAVVLYGPFSPQEAGAGEQLEGEQVETKKIKLPETSNILVVYYSWGGNTKHIADFIQQHTNAVIFRLDPITPYPKEYRPTTEQAKKEIEAGHLPPLKEVVENIDHFDTIFVGSPNWWSTIAPPAVTFLSTHNLEGKKAVPFFSHGGGGMARCEEEVKKRCDKSTLLAARTFSGSQAKNAKKEVENWLDGLDLKSKGTKP